MAGKKINIDSLNLGLDNENVIEASKIMNKEIEIVKTNNVIFKQEKNLKLHTKKNIKKTVTIDSETFDMLQEIKNSNYYINISQLLRTAIKEYYKNLFSK